MKTLFIILSVFTVLFICIMFIIIVHKATNGEPVKIWGLEMNEKQDTRLKAIDTSKKSQHTANSIVSYGKDAHNVSGTGNKVGVNGDYTVINEKELSKKNAKEIISTIKGIQLANHITNMDIMFLISNDSNLRKFAYQLKIALLNNHFNIIGDSTYEGSIEGIKVKVDPGFRSNDKIIDLYVGTSTHKGIELINP